MSMSLVYIVSMLVFYSIALFSRSDRRRLFILLSLISISLFMIGFTVIDFYETWLRILHTLLNPGPPQPPGLATWQS